ncbi:MAG: hypothetical protein JEZ08_13205 [Clostridiales bacterium]|nr:hypothetical protein [Clostridiales bacterium]
MKKNHVNDFLKAVRIKTKYLLLDGNNPRFFTLEGERISSKDMNKKEIQLKAQTEMEKYAIKQLADSIKVTGFHSVDRVVIVRAYPGSDYYVVVEGNRRFAAILKILFESEEGLAIDESVLESIKEIDALIIDTEDAYYDTTINKQLMIQAMRHISGIKPWSPIAQARAMLNLVEIDGKTPSEAAKAVGMGTTTANLRRRALMAFNNMLREEDIVLPDNKNRLEEYFSYFEELYKDKNLRSYYLWSDEKKRYTNTKELNTFYRWIGLMDENLDVRMIPKALDIRLLWKVMNHEEAYRAFKDGLDINKAYAIVLRDNSDYKINYTNQLKKINKQLEALPSVYIKSISDEDYKVLLNIYSIIKNHLGGVCDCAV